MFQKKMKRKRLNETLKKRKRNLVYKEGFLNHPRNALLTFVEETHTYYYNNVPFPYSVSKFKSKFVGKFDWVSKAKNIINNVKNGIIKENSVYFGMKNINEIKTFWDQRRDDGTYLHDKIENFIKYKKHFTDRNSKFYKDFVKFLKFYDWLKKEGWTHFVAEMMIYTVPPNKKQNPRMGGMVDLLVYRRNKISNKYEYMVIDWKRTRTPNFVDKNNVFDLIVILKNDERIFCSKQELKDMNLKNIKNVVTSPFKGRHNSTHLAHSIQLYTYVYMLEKYYAKDFFLFKPGQLIKVMNIYFHDSYSSYYLKECMDVRKEVKQMFNLVANGML